MSGPINLDKAVKQIVFRQGESSRISSSGLLNSGVEGEPIWTTDTDQLYIHIGSGVRHVPTADVNDSISVAGDVELTTAGLTRGIILKSPNGTRYRVTVDNAGALVVSSV
jgi:hypothetical protein